MSNVQSLHTRWLRDPAYREAYAELAPGFRLARTLIEVRTNAGLTQAQMAERMQTTQSVVARLESGRAHPSTRTLGEVRPGRRAPTQDQLRADQGDGLIETCVEYRGIILV